METEQQSKVPSHKLGVKFLDSRQLENTFPDYQALLKRIEEQRDIAKYASQYPTGGQGYVEQMYDNVYSILGGRGAGKSSVLLTLHEMLNVGDPPKDLIFPIITPELISERECSILGWIMAITEKIIDTLEERASRVVNSDWRRAQQFNQDSGIDFFQECRLTKKNKLRDRYEKLMRESLQDDIPTTALSFDDALGLRVYRSRKQYRLIQELNLFWDELTRAWQATNRIQNNKDNQCEMPLIILMFDDIDLVPQRSMELLSSTFQYFTNPNIVLILTAAQKVLKQAIHLKMFERMVGSNAHSLLIDAYPGKLDYSTLSFLQLDSIEQTMQEYYDKVIPPSSRYHLRRFDSIADRKSYRYASIRQSFEYSKEDDSIYLETFLKNQIDELISALGKGQNFLLDSNGKFRDAYLVMFGNKNRNIANACLEIMNTIERLAAQKRRMETSVNQSLDQGELLTTLKHMIRVLLLSIKRLSVYADKVETLIFQRSGQGKVYVDHAAVWQIYHDQCQQVWADANKRWRTFNPEEMDETIYQIFMEQNETLNREINEKASYAQKDAAAMIVILTFADHLLLLMDPSRGKIHGHHELSLLLNADIFGLKDNMRRGWTGFQLFPVLKTVDEFLDRSPMVMEHLNRYVDFHPFSLTRARDYLMDTFYYWCQTPKAKDLPHELKWCHPAELLMKESIENRDWVQTVMSMLYIRYSKLTYIKSNFIQFSQQERSVLDLVTCGSDFNLSIEPSMTAFLQEHDIKAFSDQCINSFRNIIERPELSLPSNLQTNLAELFKCQDAVPLISEMLNNFIPKINALFQINRNKVGSESFMEWYLRILWRINKMPEQIDPFQEPYLILKFMETILSNSVAILRMYTELHLTVDNIKYMIQELNKIKDLSKPLRKEKETLIHTLEMLLAQNDKLIDPPEGVKNYIKLRSELLIDFLLGVEKEWPDIKQGISYLYENNVDIYFALHEYLVPYPIGEEDAYIGQYKNIFQVPFKVRNRSPYKMLNITSTVKLALDLRAAQFLLPYYFAAYLTIELERSGQSEEVTLLHDSEYPLEIEVEDMLKALYNQLTKSHVNLDEIGLSYGVLGQIPPLKIKKLLETLCPLMQKARQTVFKQYYNSLLEASHE